jgi:hypothetical protein
MEHQNVVSKFLSFRLGFFLGRLHQRPKDISKLCCTLIKRIIASIVIRQSLCPGLELVDHRSYRCHIVFDVVVLELEPAFEDVHDRRIIWNVASSSPAFINFFS